ncbi:MAG: hypothetical protein AABX66_04025 [Nanoarchaeota archaeon]
MKRGSLIFIILCIFLISIVCAHQPRLVFDKTSNIESPFIINNPEISQAFYGNLKGQEDFYQIYSDKPFNLYLNILSPAITGATKDFNLLILKDNKYFANLSAKDSNWTLFHEKFANDDYYKGPEFQENVSSGTYIIEVSSLQGELDAFANSGKYSLAVGQIESFQFKEALNTELSLPKLKSGFFDKSPLTAYFNVLGLFLLGILIVIILLIILVIFVIKILISLLKRKR